MNVDVAVLHLGGVRFPVTGPVRYSMTAAQAVKLCELLQPTTVVPVHYEGWQHFHQGRAAAEREIAKARPVIASRFQWLPLGMPLEVSA